MVPPRYRDPSYTYAQIHLIHDMWLRLMNDIFNSVFYTRHIILLQLTYQEQRGYPTDN
ncbi:hypothetical protein Plhal304r1_c005g0022321 [Plasmopara halstedii]